MSFMWADRRVELRLASDPARIVPPLICQELLNSCKIHRRFLMHAALKYAVHILRSSPYWERRARPFNVLYRPNLFGLRNSRKPKGGREYIQNFELVKRDKGVQRAPESLATVIRLNRLGPHPIQIKANWDIILRKTDAKYPGWRLDPSTGQELYYTLQHNRWTNSGPLAGKQLCRPVNNGFRWDAVPENDISELGKWGFALFSCVIVFEHMVWVVLTATHPSYSIATGLPAMRSISFGLSGGFESFHAKLNRTCTPNMKIANLLVVGVFRRCYCADAECFSEASILSTIESAMSPGPLRVYSPEFDSSLDAALIVREVCIDAPL
ncbi:hypothetical protein GGX14DRAFT_394233 [Mycena pura]|uniref:Uncharacterized protein n=1 Tax=Mycena pura TaxID=153505 RepID=A0AAD6YB67_9AGAR|nr:hypothetical protein GGX14DRAFT_394233 [Mycena pura]